MNYRLTDIYEDDATKSVIWSAAESAMTIVATSIPVLRAFINKKIGSAISYIRSSSNRSTNASVMQSRANNSVRLSTAISKKETSRNVSRANTLTRNSKNWITLDGISDKSVTHEELRPQDD